MADFSMYDYLKANGMMGVGQGTGNNQGIGGGDLSRESYRVATGQAVGPDDAGYRAWVSSNLPEDIFGSGVTDPRGNVMPGSSLGANGQVTIPDQYLSENMQESMGGWGDGLGIAGIFGGLLAGGGLLNGAFGGAGAAAGGAEGLAGGAFDMGGMAGMENGFGIGGAGMGEASWGVNSMPDFGSENMFGFEGEAAGGLSDLSTLPSPTNLQDAFTQAGKMPGGSSIVSRIMNGSATTEDWLSAAGKLVATGLGMYGSNQKSNSLNDLANKYQEYGAPSRARFESSMTPGFDPMSIPGYSGALDTASKSLLARLSATGGNPYGNPGGMIEANKQIVSGTALPAINEYQRLNANTGFGSSMNAALGLQTQGIGADANSLNALGYGINALTNQQPSLQDLIKQYSGGYKQNDWI